MTLIVGLKHEGKVYIGADSLGSNGHTGSIYETMKCFRSVDSPKVIIGASGSYRHINILSSYPLFNQPDFVELFELNKRRIDESWLIKNFIPRLKKLFKDLDSPEKPTFLIGAGDELYEIQTDWSILKPSLDYMAVGSGQDHAMAALGALEGMDITPEEKILRAMLVTSENVVSVNMPCYIVDTESGDVGELDYMMPEEIEKIDSQEEIQIIENNNNKTAKTKKIITRQQRLLLKY